MANAIFSDGTSYNQFGWIDNKEEANIYAATLPVGDDFWANLAAKDDNGDRFFYRALVLALTKDNNTDMSWIRPRDNIACLRSYNQGSIGSCVGNGKAKEKSYRAALDIFMDGQAEQFEGMMSAEWEYYASRKQAGLLRSGDGSTGYGAAKASTDDGALPYGALAGISNYDVGRCRSWGRGSVPDDAIKYAQTRKNQNYLKVDSAEKVWTAAGFGLPFAICSNQGFDSHRDSDGAIKPRGSWGHCMCGGSARRTTASGRKLILIDQSWGDDWTPGPYYEDQPWGSFYADLDVVASMCKQGDTFVSIDFQGKPEDRVKETFIGM